MRKEAQAYLRCAFGAALAADEAYLNIHTTVVSLDLTLASSYNPAFVTANGGTTAGAETALAKIEKTVSHFLPGQPIHCQQYHVLFSPAERRRTVVAGYGAPAFL